jgi:hypothetical protein
MFKYDMVEFIIDDLLLQASNFLTNKLPLLAICEIQQDDSTAKLIDEYKKYNLRYWIHFLWKYDEDEFGNWAFESKYPKKTDILELQPIYHEKQNKYRKKYNNKQIKNNIKYAKYSYFKN